MRRRQSTARKVFGPAPEFFEPRPDSFVVGAEWVQAAGAEEDERVSRSDQAVPVR
jgi:hypothetical protein